MHATKMKEGKSVDDIKAADRALGMVMAKIGSEMYSSAESGPDISEPPSDQAGQSEDQQDDDVTEAEFKEKH